MHNKTKWLPLHLANNRIFVILFLCACAISLFSVWKENRVFGMQFPLSMVSYLMSVRILWSLYLSSRGEVT